jgi:amino acid adenylation domain-containing protein
MNPPGLLHEGILRGHPPEAPALLWASGSLDHGTLRANMLHIASRLQACGVRSGDRVALALPKSPEMVQALLGVLAAGAAYVPVDPQAPAARIAALLQDAQPALVLATSQVLQALGPATTLQARAIDPAADGSGLDAWLREIPESTPVLPPSGPDFLASILYTSGTTGRPKGVALTHGNIGSFVAWAAGRLGLRAEDRFASHAPLHFDLSTLDLFAPFLMGGSVVLLDEKAVRFPAAVARVLEERQVTVWYSVPTALRMLEERGNLAARDLSRLRLVLFAGEPFPPAALRALMRLLPHPRYANLYGPTETNVCTYHLLPGPPAENEAALPIGIPCEHLEVSLRDEAGKPVPEGTPGEMCVAGPGVMAGYWQAPEATRAVRLEGREDSYRTGDYGVLRPDGLIQFLGRRDQQVKIRGHRIELLEIESHLLAHPGVRQAAAVCSGPSGDVRILAFVEPVPGSGPSPESLQAHCARVLPAYALPARIEIRNLLPLTATGKLDRRKLAEEGCPP